VVSLVDDAAVVLGLLRVVAIELADRPAEGLDQLLLPPDPAKGDRVPRKK